MLKTGEKLSLIENDRATLKYSKPMMGTAKVWAQMSYCDRRKVGAVLEKGGRALNTGYNGTISGQPNDCEEACALCDATGTLDDITCPKCQGHKRVTNKTVIHAEKNLIAFCAKRGIPTDGCTVYITLSPCVECASLMKQAGIVRVIYDEQYRDTSGIEFLKEIGVDVVKYSDIHNG